MRRQGYGRGCSVCKGRSSRTSPSRRTRRGRWAPWWWRSASGGEIRDAAAGAGGGAPATTAVRVVGAGGTSTWGRCRASSRRRQPRVRCRDHGVVVAWVPWARHGAGHTRAFDDTAAWLAVRTAKSAVMELLRISWRTVGRIVTRVSGDAQAKVDRFAGLRRIGIDEISYKRGHRYLTVVVDHDSGRLVWAAVGRDEATLRKFFDELGESRCAAITLVSADAAGWIAIVVAERCQNATLCLDPFHICQWASKALDEVRRERSGMRLGGAARPPWPAS